MTVIRNVTLTLAIAVILSTPAFAQRDGQGRGPGRGGPGMAGSVMGLLMAPPVQEELGLSEQQVEQIRQAGEELRSDMQARFQELRDLEPAQRREQFEAMQDEMDTKTREAVKDVLKPEQMERLEQIRLQQAGFLALAVPEVQEKLGLSDEQKNQLQEIIGAYRSEAGTLMQNAREQENRREIFQQFVQLREQSQEKALAVLTSEQQSTWKEMQGEPFEMGPGRFGGGRPGGGRGPGRGPGGRPGERP